MENTRGVGYTEYVEVKVLPLTAGGKANAEIAGELVIGEAAVKAHVSNPPAKLRLRDRAPAVVLADECGLVQPGSA